MIKAVILRKADSGSSWVLCSFSLAGLCKTGHRNETSVACISMILFHFYHFRVFLLAISKPSRQMKGSGSIFSKLAPWYLMESLLTDPALQLKNTFWRPAEPVSGTRINVIPSPAPSRTSPERSFICSHICCQPDSLSVHTTPEQLCCYKRSAIVYRDLYFYFRKTMHYNISSIRKEYHMT